jgi:hypothetical protein
MCPLRRELDLDQLLRVGGGHAFRMAMPRLRVVDATGAAADGVRFPWWYIVVMTTVVVLAMIMVIRRIRR